MEKLEKPSKSSIKSSHPDTLFSRLFSSESGQFRPFGLVLVVLVSLACFLPGLTTIPPMDRDETRFAQASKQMVTSGDYITPRFQQDLRAKKPIGIYWMQSVAANIFGKDDISSYRVPSLIGGLVVVIVTTIFARMILPRREAIFAGLFMATSLLVVVESHLAKTDAMLAAFIVIQQLALWKIHKLDSCGHYVSGKYALLFWGALGASLLIKGPIGVIIAAATIAMMILTSKNGGWQNLNWRNLNWKWVFALKPILGLTILTAMVLPWVLMVSSATDGAFLSLAVKGDFISKLQSGQESHGAPPLTYLAIVIITFWPGSLFLARAAAVVYRRWREADIIFLLSWLVPFWIMLELTPTKLPHYNLPVFAALAMLASLGVGAKLPEPKPSSPSPESSPKTIIIRGSRYIKSPTFSRLIIQIWEWGFIAVGPLFGIVAIYAATFADGSRASASLALLSGCGVSLAAYWWQKSGKTASLILMLGGAVLFHIIMLGSVLPSLSSIKLAPRIAAEVATITPPPTLITTAGYHEPSLVFALGTETLLFSPSDAAFFLAEADDGLALIERRSDAEFRAKANAIGLEVVSIRTVTGFNISRGQDMTIYFYRRKQ